MFDGCKKYELLLNKQQKYCAENDKNVFSNFKLVI